MAITITNATGLLKIAFPNQTMWLPKPFRVTQKVQRGSIWLLSGDEGRTVGRSDVKIDYSEVVSPVTASISALAELLATYSIDPQSASGNFTDADLTAGVLTIVHNLGTTHVALVVRDPAGLETLQPNTVVDNNTITVDFGGSIGAGTFTYFVLSR